MSENGAKQYGLARVMTNGDMVYEDAYLPKNILLTGGAGFIGSHVAILLAKKYPEYKVRAHQPLEAPHDLNIHMF